MLESNKDKNDQKIDEKTPEINRIKKTVVGRDRNIENIEKFLWELMSERI